MKECCICKKKTNEPHLHNAQPYAKGECCSKCNAQYVIPTRLKSVNLAELNKIRIYQTSGIANACGDDFEYLFEVFECLRKYLLGDWGDTCLHDKKLNNLALKTDNDRIVAKYTTTKGNIFIITEADRSATTILFANEY